MSVLIIETGQCRARCVMSAGNTLSVRELTVVACSVLRQIYNLKMLSISVLGAEGASGGWRVGMCLVGGISGGLGMFLH